MSALKPGEMEKVPALHLKPNDWLQSSVGILLTLENRVPFSKIGLRNLNSKTLISRLIWGVAKECYCSIGISYIPRVWGKERGTVSHGPDVGERAGIWFTLELYRGFPGSSDGKESICNAGDVGSILGSGSSPGERNGNPLHYSCLAWKIPWARDNWWATVHEATKSRTCLSDLSIELSKRLNIFQATETDVITRFLGTDKGISD